MTKEILQDALELLAVATFITPKLQAKRTAVINAGLQALEHPAQRTWVSLTDEEMQDLWDRYAYMEMMRATEAKLRSKNT